MAYLLHSLDDASVSYDHIYLSPHIDDAALSCGGSIARHAANHQPVLVVTICTGAPPAGEPLSAYAEELHGRWQLGTAQAVQARLQEDLAAMECLNADHHWLGLLDAIYRRPDSYASDAALFGQVAPDDALRSDLAATLADLARRFPGAVIYAPLGIGNHVDHQITCAAAMALAQAGGAVAFYEDFPYAAEPGALHRRFEQLGGHFVPSVLDIDATLARKISAIESYTSQIPVLFGDGAAMARAVTSYAEHLRPDVGTYGERLWLLQH